MPVPKTNWIHVLWPQRAWVNKTVYRAETHWLSRREKVLSTVFNKEGQVYSFLKNESTHSWKSCNHAQANVELTPTEKKSPFLLNGHRILISTVLGHISTQYLRYHKLFFLNVVARKINEIYMKLHEWTPACARKKNLSF